MSASLIAKKASKAKVKTALLFAARVYIYMRWGRFPRKKPDAAAGRSQVHVLLLAELDMNPLAKAITFIWPSDKGEISS
jgi:hypothetical protein